MGDRVVPKTPWAEQKGRVIAKCTVHISVTLPGDYVDDPTADDDPVVECAMQVFNRIHSEIYLNGAHRPPFIVVTEMNGDGVKIKKDGRL